MCRVRGLTVLVITSRLRRGIISRRLITYARPRWRRRELNRSVQDWIDAFTDATLLKDIDGACYRDL